MRPRSTYRISVILAAVLIFSMVVTLALGVQVNMLNAAGETPTPSVETALPDEGTDSTPDPVDPCADAAENAEGCTEDTTSTSEPTEGDTELTETPPADSTEEPLEEGTAEPTEESVDGEGTDEPAEQPTEVATEEATEEAPEDSGDPPADPTEEPQPEMFNALAAPMTAPLAVLQQAIAAAGFTATVGANRTVQFTDNSTADQPIDGWLWNFGDGATSTEQNPQHQYAADGTYNVSLTVTFQDGSTLGASGQVVIDSSQTGSMTCDFDMQTLGDTVPLTVNFINNSQNATSYQWNFGDGGTSTMSDPSHVYENVGTYDITLTCTGPLGTLQAFGELTVTETPGIDALLAQFIVNPTNGPVPLTVTVEDVSLGNVVSWSWSFGDGTTATGEGPHTHTYTVANTYTITLTVTDDQGNTSTATGTVTAVVPGTRPQPSFTVSPQQGSAPLTVTVTDTSQGQIDSWTWTFGDGSAAVTGQGPHTHTYTTNGTFTIRLQVSGPGGAGTATRQVVVSPPGSEVDAVFSFQITGAVPGGIEVCFTDQSVGNVVSWEWDFGDGGTSTSQNPCHVYAGPGNYTVTLVVTGEFGNISTGTRIVPVVSGTPAPIAAFRASSTDITVGTTVQFTNESTGEIDSYAWNFGDGGTSSEENPSHTYNQVGTFIVELRVTGPGGTSEAAQTTITVRELAQFSCNFSGTTSPLLNQTVTYRATYQGLNGRTVTSQSWTLGTDVVSTGNTWQTTWTTPGQFTLTYTAVLDDGTDCTVTKTITVAAVTMMCVIDGPGNANAFQERTYRAQLQGGPGGTASYAWTVDGQPFGGNTQQITVIAPLGQPSMSLRVVITVGGETVECERTVTINRGGEDRLVCDYTGDITPLLNQTITYTGTVDGLFNRTATYQWFLNGQPVGTDSTMYAQQWTTSGTFTLTFQVTPSEGEICVVSKTITVSTQTLECDIVGPFPARVGIPAVYEALVEGLGNRTASYEWQIDGLPAGNAASIERTFNNTGSFSLFLRVTTNDGDVCEVSRNINIEIGQRINAIANPNAGVAPLPVTFTAETINIDRSTLVWHFPNGSTQASEVGNFTFLVPGDYTVRVTGTGPLGQQEASVVVRVGGPNDIRAAFTPSVFSGIAPLEVCFTDRSVSDGSPLNGWTWTFGDGSTSTDQNPCHTYTAIGNYQVQLDVTNTAGLTARATNQINVFSLTQGSASFGFNIFPNGLVCFTSVLTNGSTLDLWEFGDGTTSTEENPCHTYPAEGDYEVVMWASGTDVHRTIRVQFNGQQDPPMLQLSGACTMTGALFTIVNAGGTMQGLDSYTVTNQNGVTVAQGDFQLGPTDSQTIEVTGPGVFTLRVQGANLSAVADCVELPQLSYGAVCVAPGTAAFTATNSGSAMQSPVDYQILTGAGAVLDSGSFQLGAGQSQTFSVTGFSGLVRMLVAGSPVIDTTCDDGTPPPPPPTEPPTTPPPTEPPVTPPPTTPPPPDEPPVVPPGPPPVEPPVEPPDDEIVCGAITEQPVAGGGPGFPLIDMNPEFCVDEELPLASWTPIEIGEAVCPEWFVYHTNQTGDWEIFRYGDLPGNPDADVNLSKGIGEQIYDIGPSRSPDAGWIAFASNRDENWEIYVATTDGEFQQRVTNNTRAIDYDPVWSPVGDLIVFESSRDGNWELYAVNVATGEQTRLTDNPANDLNAFWSPDGTRIVFESDRDGLWQIYELDLATLEVTRISDGTANDQDPTYSMDGERVAFRSDRDGGTGIYVMNRDGTDLLQISDPNGQATLPVFSPDDTLLAYQSDLNGTLDIYVYEFETGTTRRVTENASPNYAPTWYCDAPQLILTSDVTGDANLFTTPALPIDAAPVTLTNGDGVQLTTNEMADQHPQNVPSEENASRERSVVAPPRNP